MPNIFKICSAVARRQKVCRCVFGGGGGGTNFFRKVNSKKRSQRGRSARYGRYGIVKGGLIKLLCYVNLFLNCIERGLPLEFLQIRYKIGQFWAFVDTSTDIYQCYHNKRVDVIKVICII